MAAAAPPSPMARVSSAKFRIEKVCENWGKVRFPGSQRAPQPWARVPVDRDPREVLDLMVDYWKLELPGALISINGPRVLDSAADSWTQDTFVSMCLRLGLETSAERAKAWLLTGGSADGVGAYAGDALKKLSHDGSLPCVGVLPWGLVRSREKMVGGGNGKVYRVVHAGGEADEVGPGSDLPGDGHGVVAGAVHEVEARPLHGFGIPEDGLQVGGAPREIFFFP